MDQWNITQPNKRTWIHVMTWLNLERIMLSDRSQNKGLCSVRFHLDKCSEKDKLAEERSVIAWSREWEWDD